MFSLLPVFSCVFALGSYVGGDEYLQEVSTSMYDPSSCLSVPKYPENASPRCFKQTIPLPYHVTGAMPEGDLLALESKCLRAFHKKLSIRMLLGKPVRALLLELILGGNGCTLSDRFLANLGRLCLSFHVAIIVDEVLTGARSLGPKMVLTTSKPNEFTDAVKYITMGKFIGCALVLKKTPKKPVPVEEKLRGTSTVEDCGLAYMLWEHIAKVKKGGAILQRQKEVLKAMNLLGASNRFWGEGLLLFSEIKRPEGMRALKNRLLPMIDVGLKIRKAKCLKSVWSREKVTSTVVETVDEWLVEQEAGYGKASETAFLASTVDCLFFAGEQMLEPKSSHEYGYFRLRPEDVIGFIGKQKAEEMANNLCRLKQKEAGRTSPFKTKSLTFVKEALLAARANAAVHETGLVMKKRKTTKRKEFTYVHSKLFGSIAKNDANEVIVYFS